MSLLGITEIIKTGTDVTLSSISGKIQRVINTSSSASIIISLSGGNSFSLSAGQYCDCFYDEGSWFNERDSYKVAETTDLEASIYATQQRNLVYNHDFRLYSNRLLTVSEWSDYKHPDGWIYSDDGTDGVVGFDDTNKCCKLTTSTDGTGFRIFKQSLNEIVNWSNYLQGKTVTLIAKLKGANATVNLTDGITAKTFTLQNTGAVEEALLQIDVSESATELTVSIETSNAGNTIEIHKVYCNRGNFAIETLPCIVEGIIGRIHSYDATEAVPAGELELNGVELPSGYSRLESYLNGKFGKGANGRSKIRDGRGYFERQWDNGAGNDPNSASRTDRGDGITGDMIGTGQGDSYKSHNHSYVAVGSKNEGMQIVLDGQDSGHSDRKTSTTGTSGSNETRPKNQNVLKTIKWC